MRGEPLRYSAGFVAGVLLLIALLLLPAAQALAQTTAGSFQTVSGQVQIQRTGGATIGAATGVGVNVGDRIITGPTGHAVILLTDNSRLELGPASSITLDQFTLTGAAPVTRVSLFSGVLRSLVNASAGGAPADYQVHTPNAVAAVRGTRFDTAYSENVIRPGYQGCEKYTDVSVYQGTVNLAPAGNPALGKDVHAGYESTLPCDKPPTDGGPLSMTGAVSLDSALAGGAASSFIGASAGSGGAPPPACPVCVSMTAPTGGGHPPPPPPPPPPYVAVH
jgi:FecR protein